MVAFVGIPAFIVTLAGMLLFRGLTLVLLTGGTISGLPDGFTAIGAGWLPPVLGYVGNWDSLTLVLGAIASVLLIVQQLRTRATLRRLELPREVAWSFWLKNAVAVVAIMAVAFTIAAYNGTPIVLIILAVLVLAYTFVLNRTTFGRHIYAMGGNLFAAVMSGVKTKWVNFFIFVNMGVLAGLAAVVSTARAGGAVASAGQNYETGCHRGGVHRWRRGAGRYRYRRRGRRRWSGHGRAQHGSVHPQRRRGLADGDQGHRSALAVAFDIFNKRRNGGV